MNTLLKLLVASLVLLAPAFSQEPKHAVVAHETAGQSGTPREQLIATGSPRRPAPLVQPKALPPLNPSLGEIARRAREARAAAPKAQVVVADDVAADTAPSQK